MMQWIKGGLFFLLLLFNMQALAITASTQPVLRFEGILSHNGVFLNGTHEIKCELFSNSIDPNNKVWESTYSAFFTDGSFDFQFGSNTQNPIQARFFEGEQAFFRFSMGEDQTVVTLNPVPKAVYAIESSYATEAGSIKWEQITQKPTLLSVDTSLLYFDTANHRVGIATRAPNASFSVNGTVFFENLPLSPSTATRNTFLMIDNGHVSQLQLSEHPSKGFRVNPAGSGIEFYDFQTHNDQLSAIGSLSHQEANYLRSSGSSWELADQRRLLSDLGLGAESKPAFSELSIHAIARINNIDVASIATINELRAKKIVLLADRPITLPDRDGQAGQVLQTDGAGQLSWTTVQQVDNRLNQFSALDLNSGTTNQLIEIRPGGELHTLSTTTFVRGLGLGSASTMSASSFQEKNEKLSELANSTLQGNGFTRYQNGNWEVISTHDQRQLLGLGTQQEAVFSEVSANTIHVHSGAISTTLTTNALVASTIAIQTSTHSIHFPTTDGQAGQVLKTDSLGRLYWGSSQSEDIQLNKFSSLNLSAGEANRFICIDGAGNLSVMTASSLQNTLGLGSAATANTSQLFSLIGLGSAATANVSDFLTWPQTAGNGSQFLKDDGTWSSLPALDDNLSAIAALNPAQNDFLVRGATAWTKASPDLVRATLGLGTAALREADTFQTISAHLTQIASLTPDANTFMVRDTSQWQAISTSSARATLGLSKTQTPSFQNVKVESKLMWNNNNMYIQGTSTTSTQNNLILYAKNKIYIATGDNTPETIIDFDGHIGPIQSEDGIFLNNGKTPFFNQSQNPITQTQSQFYDQYAVHFIHHAAPRNKDAKTDSLLHLSLQGPHITNQTQYIGFSGNNDTLIGKISARFNPNNGVVQSGITLESSGADYAEYLEKIYPQEVIKKGDVVGVFNGKITKNTRDAQKVMVVSSMPLVIGNWKGKKRDDLYQPIAFVGQVPVRVRGPVHAGDVIIPSGRNDGTATAVHPDQLSIEQAAAIIGTAWGSSETDHNDLKTITTVTVAITPLDSPISLFKKLKAEQSRLKEENQALKEGLEELRKEFDMLRHAVLPKRT